MPHHWWLIDPDNPNAKERAAKVREAAKDKRGKVVFVGCTSDREWYALVRVDDPADEDEVYRAVGGRGKLLRLDVGFDPDDPT